MLLMELSLSTLEGFRSEREIVRDTVLFWKVAEFIKIVDVYGLVVFTSFCSDVRKAVESGVTTPAERDESGGKVAGEVFEL